MEIGKLLKEYDDGTLTVPQKFHLAASLLDYQNYSGAVRVAKELLASDDQESAELSVRLCFLCVEALVRSALCNNLYFVEEQDEFQTETNKVFNLLNQVKSIEMSNYLRSSVEFRLHLYKCRVLLLQRSQMRGCRREIKNAMEIFQHSLRPLLEQAVKSDNEQSDGSQYVYAAGGMAASLERQNQVALNLKANLEYLKGNHRKALKLVSSSHLLNGEAYVGHNNVACIYFKVGKYPAATLFFQEATQLFGSSPAALAPVSEPSDLPACAATQSGMVDVMYNYALSLLHSNQPSAALTVLRAISASSRGTGPLLWLRMAECAAAIHDLAQNGRPEQLSRLIVTGNSRKFALGSQEGKMAVNDGEDTTSLRDAVAYLSTALVLVRSRRLPGSFTELKGERLDSADAAHHLADGNPQVSTENDSDSREFLSLSDIEDNALLLMAYVQLSLQNYVAASNSCRMLLSKHTLSDRVRHLTQTYFIEAQLALGAAAEVDLSQLESGPGGSSRLINRAAVQVARGDLNCALSSYLSARELAPNDADATKGIIYIYLRLGKYKEALQYARTRFSMTLQ